MTPEQKIKHAILVQAAIWDGVEIGEVTSENVDQRWDGYGNPSSICEAANAIRNRFDEETDIPCQWSRQYESKSVAAKMPDGSWVGWTYWYGGGKHGEPEAIDWMDDAYDLACTEEEKVVIVRTFTKQVPA